MVIKPRAENKNAPRNKSLSAAENNHIEVLNANIANLRDAIGTLAISVSVQAGALAGFKELYSSERDHIHRMLDGFKSGEARRQHSKRKPPKPAAA